MGHLDMANSLPSVHSSSPAAKKSFHDELTQVECNQWSFLCTSKLSLTKARTNGCKRFLREQRLIREEREDTSLLPIMGLVVVRIQAYRKFIFCLTRSNLSWPHTHVGWDKGHRFALRYVTPLYLLIPLSWKVG